ncbi:transketolase [Candidatus Persebacteraceae bacterium Df01]|jgi:transketolase|uniref:Transketolase n=1 Tax=Candidatus Doriopsillibacter californiensis TaxID=2970740 RepID=A0ABT7QKQ8_9GAMM|nr:transketolase [Candidatus Persebacteraceae bacterium Df01]
MTDNFHSLANCIRFLSMDAVQRANCGHPGMPMGMADTATVLFSNFLKFDAAAPDWPDRDRFVLSAGHGSMLLYSLLYLTGYPQMDMAQIKNFRQWGSLTPGHPEYGHTPGVETTTGPLGQGLATAVGLALAEHIERSRFGSELVDHRTYVIAGDGCLSEGISHEAASLAGHLRLHKLIVLFDDNGITIDGDTSLSVSDDQLKRFAAYGWKTLAVDGHDSVAVREALRQAQDSDRPTLIACKTVIGFGAPNKRGTSATHGAPLGEDEIAAARKELDWPHAPFVIPQKLLDEWRCIGARGAKEHDAWQQRLQTATDDTRQQWQKLREKNHDTEINQAISGLKEELTKEAPAIATRKAGERTLSTLAGVVEGFIGGSADLTGSNNTKVGGQQTVTAQQGGAYLYYGVREHAMAAAMNGMALHGLTPYGGTFLVFSDYCRPAMRLSALMNLQVIYVMTHDSIGLGEDGPTHQPVEHLSSLRAIPNLHVYRPADAMETAECWEAALLNKHTPSVIALSRQSTPALPPRTVDENLCLRGAYVIDEPVRRDVTLLATGTEVVLALATAQRLEIDGIIAAVVSVPCWEHFEQQPVDYRQAVLGVAPRFAVEAASPHGWERYAPAEHIIALPHFGASAKAETLYERFGFSVATLVTAIKSALTK